MRGKPSADNELAIGSPQPLVWKSCQGLWATVAMGPRNRAAKGRKEFSSVRPPASGRRFPPDFHKCRESPIMEVLQQRRLGGVAEQLRAHSIFSSDCERGNYWASNEPIAPEATKWRVMQYSNNLTRPPSPHLLHAKMMAPRLWGGSSSAKRRCSSRDLPCVGRSLGWAVDCTLAVQYLGEVHNIPESS